MGVAISKARTHNCLPNVRDPLPDSTPRTPPAAAPVPEPVSLDEVDLVQADGLGDGGGGGRGPRGRVGKGISHVWKAIVRPRLADGNSHALWTFSLLYSTLPGMSATVDREMGRDSR